MFSEPGSLFERGEFLRVRFYFGTENIVLFESEEFGTVDVKSLCFHFLKFYDEYKINEFRKKTDINNDK